MSSSELQIPALSDDLHIKDSFFDNNVSVDNWELENSNQFNAFINDIFISKTGSLITNMYFEFSLPPAAAPGAGGDGVVSNYLNYAHWVNNVGHAIIDEVSLCISNNLIDIIFLDLARP